MQHFNTIIFLNNPAGIPSPPLALLTEVLPKAHLTSHSRMSGSEWETTPLWLPGLSGKIFFFFFLSSVYSFYLFWISSASIRSLSFLSFIVPIFRWNFTLISPIFLQKSLAFSFYCFPLFLSLVHWWRPACLSLLFSGTSYLAGCTLLFLYCFSLFFFFFSFCHL